MLTQRGRGTITKNLSQADGGDIETAPQPSSSNTNNGKMPAFGSSLYEEDSFGRSGTLKQWAFEGIRRRSCRVICSLILIVISAALVLLYFYATFYGWLHTRDPCVVSVEELHQLRSYPRQSLVEPGFKPMLPKIIHQQWKVNKIPDGMFTVWSNKFKKLFREGEYTHMLWTDESARELIKNDFSFFLKTYDDYKFGIQRADAARYFILYKYGGLYADLDYEPLTNFWDHLPTDRVGQIESPYLFNERTQNSLMSSPRGDPFWNATFSLLMERGHLPVLLATGPMFLDVLLKKAKEPYHVLPCENFQRLPFGLKAGDDHSPFLSKLHREVFGRLMPMKYCGDYHDPTCQFGKHHNTVSYIKDTGVLGTFMG